MPNHSFFQFVPRATGKTSGLQNSKNAGLWINLLLDEELIPILTSAVQFLVRVDALAPGSWVVIDEVQVISGCCFMYLLPPLSFT